MHKIFFLIIIIVTSCSNIIFCDTWEAKQFEQYRFERAVAIEASDSLNWDLAITHYINAANIAEKNNMVTVWAWQLNNAARCIIKVYERDKDKSVLVFAKTLLEKAKQLNIEETLPKINSNLKYVQNLLGE